MTRNEGVPGYADSEPGVQLLIDQIGGVHNVHLARLWSARKFLILEGKDLSLLRRFHAVLHPDAELSIDALPSVSIGGWGGWQRAIGSSLTLKNAVGDRISAYCILDRDYHTDGEIEQRLDDARRAGVQLHIWSAKEIENFLLNENTVRRVITRRAREENVPTAAAIRKKILQICGALKDTVVDGFATEIQKREHVDLVSANQQAREYVNSFWQDEQRRVSAVPGKEVLSRLSEWSQQECGVSIGAPVLGRHISKAEIPQEIVRVMDAIESGTAFPSSQSTSSAKAARR